MMLNDEQEKVVIKKKSNTAKSNLLFVAFLVILSIAVFLSVSWLKANVITNYSIEGTSMNPTMQHGDIVWGLLSSKAKHSDVVVVDVYGIDEFAKLGDSLYIKRAVAFEGDSVWIEDGYLCIKGSNGDVIRKQQEVYDGKEIDKIEGVNKYIVTNDGLHNATELRPYIVSANCVYLLGDNRNNSRDSRYFGEVPLSAIKAVVIGYK